MNQKYSLTVIKLDYPCWNKNYLIENRQKKYWKRSKHPTHIIKQKYMSILNLSGKSGNLNSSFNLSNCWYMYLRRYWKQQWKIRLTFNVFTNWLFIVIHTIVLITSTIRKEPFWKKSRAKNYSVISFSGNSSYSITFEQLSSMPKTTNNKNKSTSEAVYTPLSSAIP